MAQPFEKCIIIHRHFQHESFTHPLNFRDTLHLHIPKHERAQTTSQRAAPSAFPKTSTARRSITYTTLPPPCAHNPGAAPHSGGPTCSRPPSPPCTPLQPCPLRRTPLPVTSAIRAAWCTLAPPQQTPRCAHRAPRPHFHAKNPQPAPRCSLLNQSCPPRKYTLLTLPHLYPRSQFS